MRWEKESKRPKYLIEVPCIHAEETIVDAYREGYINWNIYKKALEKINSNKNGSWMFEQKIPL